MTSLVIYSSLHGDNSQSSTLLKRHLHNISGNVIEKDLATLNLPHLSAAEMTAWTVPSDQRNSEQQALADISDSLIDELREASHIYIAMPMYNFGVPSVFKAWIDRVARAGETFRYTSEGPEGLLTDKKVTIVTTRGGFYQGTPMDVQSEYLKLVLGFIGLNDIEFIYAEGLATDQATVSLNQANEALSKRIAA